MSSTSLLSVDRIGSQLPTWRALPSDAFDSGHADDAIELAALAGLDLDEWQQIVLRDSLMVREADPTKWAASQVWLAVGRQNGKGSILEARQAFDLLTIPNHFAVHTAHELKTANEHFLRMQQLIEGCPEIERQVLRIRTGKGDEAIEMRNGARQRFIARTGGGGRGFSADCLYLDESMFLTDGMMRAIFSTMAAKSRKGNPQLWMTGSAPKADDANQAWAHAQVGMLRSDRRPDRTLYLDFGTTPPTDDDIRRCGGLDQAVDEIVNDLERLYGSNPSLGMRISEEFCGQERATLGMWGYAVERLGLVIPPESTENRSGIDLAEFGRLVADLEIDVAAGAVVAVDVDEDGAAGSVVAAQMAQGRPFFELVAQGGVGQLVAWVTKQAPQAISALVVDGSSQAQMIPTLLAAARCPVKVVTRSKAEAALDESAFVFATTSKGMAHRNDARVRRAIADAVQVQSGDRWRWSRRKSSGDVTPLKAAALAVAHVSSVDAHDPNEVFVH